MGFSNSQGANFKGLDPAKNGTATGSLPVQRVTVTK